MDDKVDLNMLLLAADKVWGNVLSSAWIATASASGETWRDGRVVHETLLGILAETLCGAVETGVNSEG